jgi:hypothetical protein
MNQVSSKGFGCVGCALAGLSNDAIMRRIDDSTRDERGSAVAVSMADGPLEFFGVGGVQTNRCRAAILAQAIQFLHAKRDPAGLIATAMAILSPHLDFQSNNAIVKMEAKMTIALLDWNHQENAK